MAKKVVTMNFKGGVAKTTTATNLASVLASDPKNKVLLVDCDSQGNTLVSYGNNPYHFRNTLYDVLIDDYPAKEVIHSIFDNLDILPSNDDMDFIDQDVWTNQSQYPVPFKLLKKSLESQIEPNYTHILFDASPSMNLINMNVLAYADSVIVPFELEETALKGIVKIVNKIKEFKEKKNPDLQIGGLLPVKVESRTNLHQMILREVDKYAKENGIFMYKEGIPKTVKFAESVTNMGYPAVNVFKSNKAVQGYYTFVDQLIERNVL